MIFKHTKILASMATIFILASCQNSSTQTTDVSQTNHTNATVSTNSQTEQTAALQLNQGAKWKADESTNTQVRHMLNFVLKQYPVTIDEFKTVSNAIKQDTDKLISGCKMRGPEHEALHTWLLPFLETNKKLANTTSVDEAKTLYADMQHQLKTYFDFFN